MDNKSEKKTKKRGRPRKTGVNSLDPRQTILDTAARLFQERGYAKTSLSEIARQVGVDQSSLYYWFKSKEDILTCMYDQHDLSSLIDDICTSPFSRTVQLYTLISNDALSKCELPFDFIELESLAHEHPERFDVLFDNYSKYYQAMNKVVRVGIENGEFRNIDPEEAVVSILSINEGLQHHYHAKSRGELILESAGYHVRNYTPEQIGHMSAVNSLAGIVSKPIDYSRLRKNALELAVFLQEECNEMLPSASAVQLKQG